MNVFWLLSTLLLWNARCVVQSRVSDTIQLGECDLSANGLYTLKTMNESFTSFSRAVTFSLIYKVSARIVILL